MPERLEKLMEWQEGVVRWMHRVTIGLFALVGVGAVLGAVATVVMLSQIAQLDSVQSDVQQSRVVQTERACELRNDQNRGILLFIAQSPRPPNISPEEFKRRLAEAVVRAKKFFPIEPNCRALAHRAVNVGK